MENPELQGVFGIVPTPFTTEGELDEEGLRHLVNHCADSGLHAAVVLGSNGEFPYLTFDEKLRVMYSAVQAAGSRIPVVAGVSAFGTREAVELAGKARQAGCRAVMAALPLYFQLDFEAVKEHFRILAEQGGLPVIFYYFPEVTGLVLGPDQIEEIAAIPGIHGAKITVFNRSFLKRVIRLTRTHLWAVFAGTAFMLQDAVKLGGAGIVCPLPLIAPADCLDLYRALQDGDFDTAKELQDKLLNAVPLIAGLDMPESVGVAYYKALLRKPYTGVSERPESSVALVKEALRLQGHPITAVVRRPCQPLPAEDKEKVKQTLESQGWI
ncbi:MAG: dihydrodipicolinate synthase family protein [bacterium]